MKLEIQLQRRLEQEENKQDQPLTQLIKNVHTSRVDNVLENEDMSSTSTNIDTNIPMECTSLDLANNADDDEWDQEMKTSPDIDEASETDVLGLPVSEIRRALLESYLAPVSKEVGLRVMCFDITFKRYANYCLSGCQQQWEEGLPL